MGNSYSEKRRLPPPPPIETHTFWAFAELNKLHTSTVFPVITRFSDLRKKSSGNIVEKEKITASATNF